MEDFGIRLKQAMDDREINASDLSRISGVGKSLISYYLHGKCLAKQDKVYQLAQALHVDPGWLLTGVQQEHSQEGIGNPDEPHTEEAKILAKGIDKLDPEQRAQALAVVKAMFAQHPEIFD